MTDLRSILKSNRIDEHTIKAICEQVEIGFNADFHTIRKFYFEKQLEDFGPKPSEQMEIEAKFKIKTEALKLAISYHGHDPLGGSPKSEYVLTTAHDFEMYLKGHTYNDPHNQPKTNITNHGSV